MRGKEKVRDSRKLAFVPGDFTGLAKMVYILELIDFDIGITRVSGLREFGEEFPVKKSQEGRVRTWIVGT